MFNQYQIYSNNAHAIHTVNAVNSRSVS